MKADKLESSTRDLGHHNRVILSGEEKSIKTTKRLKMKLLNKNKRKIKDIGYEQDGFIGKI